MGSTVKRENPDKTGHPAVEQVQDVSQTNLIAQPNSLDSEELFVLLSSLSSRKLRCEFCQSEFGLARDLRCHICPSSGIGQSYRCRFCGFACKFRDELLMHIRFHHEKLVAKPKPILYCPQCREKFANKTALNKHKNAEHPQAFTCQLCQMRLRSQKILDWHMEIHKSPESRHTKIFSCGRCLELFSTKQSLIRHLQHRHEKPRDPEKTAICATCGTDFVFGGASRIVKVNRNLCGNCDSAASVSQLIKMSSTLEEQLKVKIEVQSEGEEVAVVKENLVEVGIIKVKIEPLEEQTVPVKQESMEIGFEPTSLSFESSLPVLTTVAPSPLVWRPYHCGLCSAQFGLAEEFRRHLKSHSDESVQQSDLSNESGTTSGVHSSNTCGICAVKFRSRRYLHRHIDRGTCGPFVCQPCRFVCSSRPEFVTHQQRHGSEIAAAFKCSFCQAVYMHKRNLLRHLDRGCARFRCRKCRIRLDDLADYHRHRERVHKIVMKGHCVTCGQRFESGAELTQHFQTCSKRG